MEASVRSQPSAFSLSPKNKPYETTYNREYVLKRPSPIVDELPFGRRFLIGAPFHLNDPIGNTSYKLDFSNELNTPRGPFHRPNTNRAHRPHPPKHFPHSNRRSESLSDLRSDETKQALRNQINSTYRVDYTGSPQGFDLPLAYERSYPFWRTRAQHTLDSEYRFNYQNLPKKALNTGGRYAYTSRIPVDSVVPQTFSVVKKRSLQSIYGAEISDKTPSVSYMTEFVDSLSGPFQ